MHLIERILEGRCLPTQIDQCVALSTLLEQYNYRAHLDELINFEGMLVNLDPSTYADTVNSILQVASDEALKTMTVELSDLTPLRDRIIILTALLGFNSSDEDDRIEVLLQSDLNNEELLCELLAIKTCLDVEHFLPYIMECDKSLFTKIQAIVRSGKEFNQTVENHKLIMHNFNQYRASLEGASVLEDIINYGFIPTTSFEALYETFLPQLDQMSIQEVVDQLVGFGIYTGLESETLEDELAYYIERHYSKASDIMAANKQLYVRLKHHG